MRDIIKGVVGFGLLILIIMFAPLLTIWALNTLFPVLAIQYTWVTWGATLFLLSMVK